MQCTRCERDAGYNRAVIDLFSGATIGGLCMNCEKAEFGRSFLYSSHGSDRQCLFCQRDGQVLLPRFIPEIEPSDGDLLVRSAIEDCGSVPCLCDEHFHEVIESSTDPRSVTP